MPIQDLPNVYICIIASQLLSGQKYINHDKLLDHTLDIAMDWEDASEVDDDDDDQIGPFDEATNADEDVVNDDIESAYKTPDDCDSEEGPSQRSAKRKLVLNQALKKKQKMADDVLYDDQVKCVPKEMLCHCSL